MNKILTVTFAAACAALPAQDAAPADPVVIGEGAQRYQWVPGFASMPDGKDLGNTHGCIAVDSKGQIYFNTDTANAICVFEPNGKFVKSLGAEFRGGAHGMTLKNEGGTEYLYVAHIGRNEVAKMTLDGKVLWTIPYPEEAGIYQKKQQYRPTDITVGPDGSIYVADGYGMSYVHQYDKDRRYVRSWGGKGTEPGKMRTPHGILLDTRGDEPRIVVADRENGRLQVFDLDGGLRSVVSGVFRRPCNVYQHPDGKHLVIPDLAGRVTILNEKNELVCHLGDQPNPQLRAKNRIGRDQWQDGVFLSPHGAAVDNNGDIYVLDWNFLGRVSRLKLIRD